MAISATVWDGHDYLPQVWDRWLAESEDEGCLLIGAIGDAVVGVQHTAIQPCGVAWMEGIRVHPEYRRRGIAARLLEYAIDLALTEQLQKVRLSTAHLNEASSKLARAHGMVEVARVNIYEATPDPEATEPDVCEMQVSDAQIAEVRHRLGVTNHYIVSQWSAYELPEQKSTIDFPRHLVVDHDGMVAAVGLASETRSGNRLAITLLEGQADAMTSIARRFRKLAHAEGYEGVSAMLPQHERMNIALSQAGYQLDPELYVLVFERDLGTTG